MYFQGLFLFDRVKALAPQHPEWKTQEPFASVLKGDMKGVATAGEKGAMEMLAATHTGMTTEEFSKTVSDWIATARHPKTGRLFTEMVYQPMVELTAYLRANGFKTFIVSGGGIEFMRSDKKPNILVIWGDDIGISNISAYSGGLMGYTTPNIDRLAKEGIRFLHYYGEQSCTAGRAAFLTGQHGLRTGLTKVGFPGAPMGMSQLDPSIGSLLKSLGYATGQFGKNHVGDRNPSLPTVNGSMSSSATSIISTPRRSRNCRTIRRTPPTAPSSARVAC